jgi:hypothetical protein
VRRARPVRALALGAILLAATGSVRGARADDKAGAQVLFEEGRSLVLQKKFAQACPKFAESLRLDPGIGTMLWLADCYENNGQSASAWAEFKEAAASAALHQDPRDKVARRRAEALEPRLAKLVLVPPPEGSVPGLIVRRDGIVVGNAELGIAVPQDPGIHTLAASAADRVTWTTNVSVPDKPGVVSVVVPVLDKAAAPTAQALGGTPPPGAANVPPVTANEAEPAPSPPGRIESGTSWGTRRWIAVGTAGAGVVALGVGTFFGFDAKSTYDASNRNGCNASNNECNATGKQNRSSASTQAAVSTALFVIGGVALATGAVLYFTAPRAQPALALVPVVSPQSAGVLFSRAW